jgi:EAL domain-containing protein (putative c-di-GMP-specific phosphodiesterase class I)/GGDEF domain-containing protein/sensor domain CHASE-containing protein
LAADPATAPGGLKPAAQAVRVRAAGSALPFGKKPLRTFALVIALPAFLIYVSTAALVIGGLTMMAGEINRNDDVRTTQAMQAALDSMLASLGDAVSDEGTWDEAYLNVVVKPSAAWLDGTWGSTARAGQTYDNVMVTDALGNITFGENAIGAITGTVVRQFPSAAIMLADLDRQISIDGDAAVTTGFAEDDAGIAALAAISIHRATPGEIAVPRGNRRILWISRHLTTSVLQGFATSFQVPEPSIEGHAIDGESFIALADSAQHDLAAMVWRPDRPGDTALAHALLLTTPILFVIGLLTAFALSILRRALLRRAARSEAMSNAARTDAATGQLNEYGLLETLAQMLAGTPAPRDAAVAYVGVDNYDAVHEEHGPEIADELMRLIGDIIAREAGRLAVTGRVSRDAFAVGTTGDTAEATIREVTDKVVRRVSEPIDISGIKFDPQVSVGISTSQDAGAPMSLRTAESARRAAQLKGDRRPVFYEVASEATRVAQRETAKHLRSAIAKEEFELEYQPVFDLRAQTLVGVEALLRWKRPDGSIAPADFMPAAEASGLMGEIGLLAVRRAAREILPFKGLILGVNIATQQFDSPTFVEQFHATVAATDFPPQRLQIEIDQSLLAGQPHRAKGIIDELRESGVMVALDDFVVGQSTIEYLRQFKLDRVKLARSLVSSIDVDDSKLSLVQTTISIARSAGLSITALGVERKDQAAKLLKLGCSEFQGYLFARPMSLEALTTLIAGPDEVRKAS